MRLILWNISYQNNIDPKIEFIKTQIKDTTIVTLLEVLPHDYKILHSVFSNAFYIHYSLNLRSPSSFDTRSRQLGVVLMISRSLEVNQYMLLDRSLFPERTGLIHFTKDSHKLTILGLHSITGVDYKKAKSIQFFSFAEAIHTNKPDIVMFDANEPKTDHPDKEKIEFHSNKDKGRGAKSFFDEMNLHGLNDSYRMISNSKKTPLTVSYKTNKYSKVDNDTFNKRYDYIFVNTNKYHIESTVYLFDLALEAGSDHAMVICDISKLIDNGINL